MSPKSIDEIKKILSSQPIVAIDYALQAFLFNTKEAKQEHIDSEFFILFCKAIFQHQKIEYVNHSNLGDLLFDQNLNPDRKRFIAVCLLRLLNVCESILDSHNIKHKTLKLFDEVFAKDLYPQLDIELKSQSHLKENILKNVVLKLEKDFENLINSFNDITLITTFRSELTRKLNSKTSKAILHYCFVPKYLIEDLKLATIFKSIQQYLEEEGVKKVQYFTEAKKILADYLNSAQTFGTKYSCNYLGGFATKILELLEKDFQNNPLSKPAELDISRSDKKYPFLTKDAQFDLNLVVRNHGPGQAFDVSLNLINDDNLDLDSSERYLGNLELTSITVPISCKVTRSEKQAILILELAWKNFDSSEIKKDFCLQFESQNYEIDWDNLAIEEPYSLEPVITEDELVGRTEQLDRLIARSKAKSIGSSYIFGQKRVGKTSIAQTLKARLNRLVPSNYLVIDLEGGDYAHSDPVITIENLAKKICERIKQSNSQFDGLEIPSFNGALSPLSSFLESVVKIVPEYKILFILDEFDELPIDIYKRGTIGDTFFLSLRAISGKTNFGFILVGGEKMEFIISTQGDALNKFEPFRIDYFENHQSDFKDLVKKPVAQWNIEISERAIYELYQQTGGNPYFTKQICGELFKLIVNRRDGHITEKEVEEATKITINKLASNSFLHFWEDGLFETDRAEKRSMDRRKVLLALAEISRKDITFNQETIIEQAMKYGLNEHEVKFELRDFERRQIIVSEDDNVYKYKVPLFGKWLKEKGLHEIITTFTDLDAILSTKKQEEDAYVRPEEIIQLISNWGQYLSIPITEDKVRAWLNQFKENTEQRLMFRILKHLKFYNGDNLRTKMKEAQGIIIRGGIPVRKYETEKQKKRSDILVSYLEGNPSKSGCSYTKLFADENQIYNKNIIERGKLAQTLTDQTLMEKIKGLVFLDDFIGTGGSACQYFEELANECGELLRNPNLKVFFISVSGFQEAKIRLETKLFELNFNVKVHICDPLDESDKVFSARSKIFSKSSDLQRAKNVAYEYGRNLVNNNPLGYGDCQAAVIFPEACPNNTLPILWSDAKKWIPLFKRQ